MIDIGGLQGELGDLARLVGLVDEGGGFNERWFNDPLASLRSVLSNEPQRRALLRLLDALLPPATGVGAPAGEKWHPLLAAGQPGNLYLTVRESGSGVVVGVAGDYGTAAPVAARLGGFLPIVAAGSSVDLLPGTPAGPLALRLRVQTDLTPAGGAGIALRAVAVQAELALDGDTPSAQLKVVLEGLSLDGEAPTDKLLDPAQLGAEAPDLLAGLIKQVVKQDPLAAAIVSDAIGLLGLAENTIPAFPFAQLVHGPAALQGWLSSLFDGGVPPVQAWLQHFAGLFRALFGAPPAVERVPGSDSYSIALIPFDPQSQLRLVAARRDGQLRLGLMLRLAQSLSGARFSLEGGAALVELPLSGTGRARVLPEAFVHLQVSGDGATRLVPLGEAAALPPPDNDLRLAALVAGLRFDGRSLSPRLELQGVHFLGTAYPQLDLTHTDSVAAAASAAVAAALDAALGNSGMAVHLLALAGLAPPRDPSQPNQPLAGWPHRVDLARLVTDPTGAIAAVHRAALRDAAFGWAPLFHALARLVPGLGDAIDGQGRAEAPWRITLGSSGPLQLQLVAFDAQTDVAAAATRQLRVGLQLSAGQAPITLRLVSELLGFDLPAQGAGQVTLMGAQSLRMALQPALAGSLLDGGVQASVDAFFAELRWAPGAALAWRAGASDLRLVAGGQTLHVPALALPAAAGFDLGDPAAAAATFGLTPATLERLLTMLVAQASAALPPVLREAGALAGLHRQAAALPPDWPLWADPASAGRLLTDPLAAARAWLRRVLTGLAADGRPHALRWLAALTRSFAAERSGITATLAADPLALVDLRGAGTYDSPWTLPLPGAARDTASLQTWIEPDGPPSAWATGIGAWIGAAASAFEWVGAARALGMFEPALAATLDGRRSENLADALALLSAEWQLGDGIVPLASQQPQIDGWLLPAPLAAGHFALPQAAAAAIGAQVDAWAGGAGGARVVLLLAPAAAGNEPWAALLAAAGTNGAKDAGALFALDDPSIPSAASFPLSGTTAVADWYVARLPDDDLPDWERHAQLIGRIVDRLGELRPGQPVTLVAHGAMGLAARHYAASHTARVRGLITLGTPHLGTPLRVLTDPDVADAVRLVDTLAADLTDATLRTGVQALRAALDGYAAPGGTAPPVRRAFPFAAYDPTGSTLDLGSVPVMALGASLSGGELLSALQVAGQALAARAAARPRAAPTHLGVGIGLGLDLGDSDSLELGASAQLRIDALQLPLAAAAPPPVRPAHGLRFEARLFRRDGWLLGGPGTLPAQFSGADPRLAFVDVRLRELRIGLDAARVGTAVQARPWLQLQQAALRGTTQALAAEADAITAGVLGELFQALSAGAGGGPVQRLLDGLSALGVVGPDPHGGVALLDDAWRALQTDAPGFIAARLPAVLASGEGWFGFSGPAEGPWVWTPPGSPLGMTIARAGTRGPWTMALRATADAGDAPLSLTAEAALSLPGLQASVAIAARAGVVRLGFDGQTLSLAAPPWVDSLVLLPAPDPAALRAELERLWPRLLFTGTASVVLGNLANNLKLAPLLEMLLDAGGFLRRAMAGEAGQLSLPRVRELIDIVARAMGLPADGTIALPAGLRLSAGGTGSAADPLQLNLATGAPLGGVLGLGVGLSIDPVGHVQPRGALQLNLPLPGSWNQLGIRFAVDANGLRLRLEPGNGIAPIELLPRFSGLGALRGAAEALLPRVLDEVVDAFAPRPAWLDRLLAVADAFGIHEAGGFAPRTAQLRGLLDGSWFATFGTPQREAVAQAAVVMLQMLPALPVAASRDGARVRLALTLPPALSGQVALAAGFDGAGPSIALDLVDLRVAGAVAARLSVSAGVAGVRVTGRFGAMLQSVGVPLTPRLDFSGDSAAGGFAFSLRPLASGVGDAEAGPLQLQIAPSFAATLASGSVEKLLSDWLLPLVAQTLVQVARANGLLAQTLWSGGPSLQAVLTGSGLFTDSAGPLRLAAPLPALDRLVLGTVKALAQGVSIDLGELTLSLQTAGRIGVSLKGRQAIDLGNLRLEVLLGAPQSWTQSAGADPGTPDADRGLTLYLLRDDAGELSLDVGVDLQGVGIALAGSDGRALLDDPSVRIGSVAAHLFLELETLGSNPVPRLGGGLRLVGFGLPLGALTGGAGGGSNPVVGALLGQGGAGGDTATPAPTTDLEFWYRSDEDRLHVRMGGEAEALWIGVHSQFGPIYIDQVGVRLTSVDAGLMVDGGVSFAGFAAQVDDLSLVVPYRTAGQIDTWKLDLKGLGIGFSQPGITISGALVKYEPPIEYNGMLLLKIGTIGAIAVGSYSVPVEANGERYTSLAIFGGVFVPIGLAPIINITALGLGVGVNRGLVVPDDMNRIPEFFLIQALDRPEQFANDPLGALLRFRNAVPARRGAFWLAAGLRGTSFEIVHVTAVLYVALDRGVEVGLLGVARAALPADDAALVSVELALKVRFSSAEGLFSVQAQLTDNSWLLSRDCQLTGGFAFFVWFRKSQFLLTLGGYHPSFQRLPEYPDVPRLGYRWNLLGVIHIKGESYFALTNTCVMAGTRLELTYGPDWLQLWFTAHADFLAQWDPFYFWADVGVAVGARLRIEVCFIGCATISISVSVGATLHLEGPPLHGTVTVDLGVTSVTVPFGPDSRPKPPPLDWPSFRLKYLQASDPATLPVGVQASRGLLPPEPPGAPVAPGSEQQPWKLSAEWSFQTETRMPARHFAFVVDDGADTPWNPAGAARFGRFSVEAQTYDLDIGPMNKEDVVATHRVFIERRDGNGWRRLLPAELAASRFAIEPVIGQVSEAAYRTFGDELPPAAANTLPALLGLRVHGNPELRSTTPDIIPIARLRDATNPRPLPFARPESALFTDVRIAGRAADRFVAIGTGLNHRESLHAAAVLLSGSDGPWAEQREASGVLRQGLGPVARRALLERRSSAPLVAPLSTGLSMEPVGQAVPALAVRAPETAPVELERPRLRAVLQPHTRATDAAPVRIRTTVDGRQRKAAVLTLDIASLQRETALPGARLELRSARQGPVATRFVNVATSVRSPQLGAFSSVRRLQSFEEAERAALGDGAPLRAGAVQVWDVPMHQRAIVIDGDQAVRVTLLTRGGGVLADAEYAQGRLELALPPTCAAVAVSGLGRLGPLADGWKVAAGPGAVTAFAAPAGHEPATGWQSSDQAVQLNARTLLVRGAVLVLSEKGSVAVHGQAMAQGVVPLSDLLSVQAAVQMHLSPHVQVLAVTLEAVSARRPGDDDLVIAVDGATLSSVPVRAAAGVRSVLLFDVTPERDEAAQGGRPIVVSIHADDDVRIVGVVGLAGTARDWGMRLNGSLPEDWVPDEALSADGSSRVQFLSD